MMECKWKGVRAMLTTPKEYADSLDEAGKSWLTEFLQYMDEAHGDIPPIMFRQRPMFKVGQSYVLFSVAKTYFTVHTLNFDLIETLHDTLPRASFGKGCVKVKFSDDAAKPILKALIDEIVRLNQLECPPEVDVVPDLPYEEALVKAFSGSKDIWLPLYEALRDAARERLPAWVEYFPAVGLRWKHESTFADIGATKTALRVEFYLDAAHPECRPIKTVQTSKNRVAHTVELTDADGIGALLDWIAASYELTKK